jgi:hypothetical protein
MSVGSSNLQGALFLLLFLPPHLLFLLVLVLPHAVRLSGRGRELVTLSLGMYAFCVSGGLGRYYFCYLATYQMRVQGITLLPTYHRRV